MSAQAVYPSFASNLGRVSGLLDGLALEAAHGFAKDTVPTGIDRFKTQTRMGSGKSTAEILRSSAD